MDKKIIKYGLRHLLVNLMDYCFQKINKNLQQKKLKNIK